MDIIDQSMGQLQITSVIRDNNIFHSGGVLEWRIGVPDGHRVIQQLYIDELKRQRDCVTRHSRPTSSGEIHLKKKHIHINWDSKI